VQQVRLSGDVSSVYGIAYPNRILLCRPHRARRRHPSPRLRGLFLTTRPVSGDGTRIAGVTRPCLRPFDNAARSFASASLSPYETRVASFERGGRGLFLWGGKIASVRRQRRLFRLDIATEKIALQRQDHEMPFTRLVVAGRSDSIRYSTHDQSVRSKCRS